MREVERRSGRQTRTRPLWYRPAVHWAPSSASRLVLACTAMLLVAAWTTDARADDAAAKLRSSGHAWYAGERDSGYLWGAAGLTSVGAAAGLRFGDGSDVARGMSSPMAGFGALQLAIGVGSLLQRRARVDALDASIARSPADARAAEIARMRTLGTAFFAIEVVEAAVLIGGASYAATRTAEGQAHARGVGLGLAIEGGAMMFLDALAAARASRYAGQLDAIDVAVVPSAGGVAVVGRF